MSETPSEKQPKKVVIFLVGSSYKAKDGDRRQVEADHAEELVRAGLARYPADKG